MSEPTVIARLETVAATQPRRVCIFCGKERITNAELAARIHAYGARLQAAHSVRPGDRVGILLKNCPEFIYALYAILKSGATVVPINTFLKAPEIQHIVDDCELKCLVTSGDFDETISKVEGVTAVRLELLSQEVGQASVPCTDLRAGSGGTGVPACQNQSTLATHHRRQTSR